MLNLLIDRCRFISSWVRKETPSAASFMGRALRISTSLSIRTQKNTKLTETKSLEFRFETFNTFNHAQFYPNGSVDGNINSLTFGRVLKAAPPRSGQRCH